MPLRVLHLCSPFGSYRKGSRKLQHAFKRFYISCFKTLLPLAVLRNMCHTTFAWSPWLQSAQSKPGGCCNLCRTVALRSLRNAALNYPDQEERKEAQDLEEKARRPERGGTQPLAPCKNSAHPSPRNEMRPQLPGEQNESGIQRPNLSIVRMLCSVVCLHFRRNPQRIAL